MEPGYEFFCEDCRARIMMSDECGISYECNEYEDCDDWNEAE